MTGRQIINQEADSIGSQDGGNSSKFRLGELVRAYKVEKCLHIHHITMVRQAGSCTGRVGNICAWHTIRVMATFAPQACAF